MSSKSSGSSRTSSPRAMPVETIITRFKSAQQRKLREMDRSMQKITELLKSPKRKRRASKIQPVKKERTESQKKEDEAETRTEEEYCPSKLKRHVVLNKIMLKPKELTVIATTNKRKRTIPQKDLSAVDSESDASHPPKRLKNLAQDVSMMDMEEMIQLIEASGGVDDEGLLEILTCPSPVWWEDPPDGYREEALFTRPRSTTEMYPSVRSQIEDALERKRPNTPNVLSRRGKSKSAEESDNEQKTETKDSDNANVDVRLSLNNCDEKFIAKRSKLESVLGSLKNKTANKGSVVSNKVSVIKSGTDLSGDEQKTVVYEIVETDSEATDDDRLTDVSFHDDEHLNVLENINIPIQDSVSTDANRCSDGKFEAGEERSDDEIDDCSFLGDKNLATDDEKSKDQSQGGFLDEHKTRNFLEHDKTDATENLEQNINELNLPINALEYSSHISEFENSDSEKKFVSDETQKSSDFLEHTKSSLLGGCEVEREDKISSDSFDHAQENRLSEDKHFSSNSYERNKNENDEFSNFLEDGRNFVFDSHERQTNADEQLSRDVLQRSRITATEESEEMSESNIETISNNFLEEDNVANLSESMNEDDELQTVYVYQEYEEDGEEPQEEPTGDFLDEDRRFEENRGNDLETKATNETDVNKNYEYSVTDGNHDEKFDRFQRSYENYATNKELGDFVEETDHYIENRNIEDLKHVGNANSFKENQDESVVHKSQVINSFEKENLINIENIQNDENEDRFQEIEATPNFVATECAPFQELDNCRQTEAPINFDDVVDEFEGRTVENYEECEGSSIIDDNNIRDSIKSTSDIKRTIVNAESIQNYEPDSTFDENESGHTETRIRNEKTSNILEIAFARAFSDEFEEGPTSESNKFSYDDTQEEKERSIYEETYSANYDSKECISNDSLTVNDYPKGKDDEEPHSEEVLFLEDTPVSNINEEQVFNDEPTAFQETELVSNYEQETILEDSVDNYEEQSFEGSQTDTNCEVVQTIYEEPAIFQEPHILRDYLSKFESSALNYEDDKLFKCASTVSYYKSDGIINLQTVTQMDPQGLTNCDKEVADIDYSNKHSDNTIRDENDVMHINKDLVSRPEEIQSVRDIEIIQTTANSIKQQTSCSFDAQSVRNYETESTNNTINDEDELNLEGKSGIYSEEVLASGSFENMQITSDSEKNTDAETSGDFEMGSAINNENHECSFNDTNSQSNCNHAEVKLNSELQDEQSNSRIEETLTFDEQKDGNVEVSHRVGYKDVIDVDKFVNEQRAQRTSSLDSRGTPPPNIFLETESLSDSEDTDALVIVETPQDINPFKKLIDFDNLPSTKKFLETESFHPLEEKSSNKNLINFNPDNMTHIIETTNKFNDTKSVIKINEDQPKDSGKMKTPSFNSAADFEEYVANIIRKIQSAENDTGNRASCFNENKNTEGAETSQSYNHSSLLEEYLKVNLHEREPAQHCNGLKRPENTSSVIKFRNPDQSTINILKIESVVPRNMPPLKSCGSRRCNEGCLPTSSPPPLKRYPGVIQTNFATEPKTIIFDMIDTVTNLLKDKMGSISDSNVCFLSENDAEFVETTNKNGVRVTNINMPYNKNTKTINLCSNHSNSTPMSTEEKHVDSSDDSSNISFPLNLSRNIYLYGNEFEFAHNDVSDFEVQSLTITKLNNVNQHRPPYESVKSNSQTPSRNKGRKNKRYEEERSRNDETRTSASTNIFNVTKRYPKNNWNEVLNAKVPQFGQKPIYSEKPVKNKEKIEYYYKQCKNFYEQQKCLAGKINVTNKNVILDKNLADKKHGCIANNQNETCSQTDSVKNTPNKKIEITNDVIINKITNGNNQITINRVPFDSQILANDSKTKSINNVGCDLKLNSLNDLSSNKVLIPNKGLTINKILVTTKELETIIKNGANNPTTHSNQETKNESNTTKTQTSYDDITLNKVLLPNSTFQINDGKNESIGIKTHDTKFEVTISKVPFGHNEYDNRAKNNNNSIIEITKLPVASHNIENAINDNYVNSAESQITEDELGDIDVRCTEEGITKVPFTKHESENQSNDFNNDSSASEKDCEDEINSFIIQNELLNEFKNDTNYLKSIKTARHEVSKNKIEKDFEFLIPESPKSYNSDSKRESNNKLSLKHNKSKNAPDHKELKNVETHRQAISTNAIKENHVLQITESSNIYGSDLVIDSHNITQNKIVNETQNLKNNFEECTADDDEISANKLINNDNIVVSKTPATYTEDFRKDFDTELYDLPIQNIVSNAVQNDIKTNKDGNITNEMKKSKECVAPKTAKLCSNREYKQIDVNNSDTAQTDSESQNTKNDNVLKKIDVNDVVTTKIKKDSEFLVPALPKPRTTKAKVNRVKMNKINKIRNERRLLFKSKSKQVKFCMQCSSIYDTKLCNYCFRSSRSPNVTRCNPHYIFKMEQKFACEVCKYKTSSREMLQQHMLSKRCGNSKR